MNEEISILITGDYCPINRVQNFSETGNYKKIFNDFLQYIEKSDFSITNLECPATASNKQKSKIGPALKVSENAILTLKKSGFDMVTLANNHIMDYGASGLMDTISNCEKFELEYSGVSLNMQNCSRIFYKKIKGITVAIINIAENEFSTILENNCGAFPLKPIQNFNDINEAKKNADFVFVIIHGGHEMYTLPSVRMVETYRFFIDSGADAVIGHHTHCFSGYEFYRNKPIYYSIGNFVFDSKTDRSNLWCEGVALLIKIEKNDLSIEIIPFIQNQNGIGINLMSENEKRNFLFKMENINQNIFNSNLLEISFEDYCNGTKRMYNSFLER